MFEVRFIVVYVIPLFVWFILRLIVSFLRFIFFIHSFIISVYLDYNKHDRCYAHSIYV